MTTALVGCENVGGWGGGASISDCGSTSPTDSSNDHKRELEEALENASATFFCPISTELMRDPVMLMTGQTYDRSSIQKWLQAQTNRDKIPRCPVTNQALRTPVDLFPNTAMRKAIEHWAEQNAPMLLDAEGSLVREEKKSTPAVEPGARYTVELPKPAGIVLSEGSDRHGRGGIFVVEVMKDGNAAQQGLVSVGDELIATSAVVSKVRFGALETIRVPVNGERLQLVMNAIKTNYTAKRPVKFEFQRCAEE